MAGKTFPGIGDLEDESLDPADAADTGANSAPSGQFYSGPTVVDDAKVEEGLKKLRSLDAAPNQVIGAVDSASELLESGAHQMPGALPVQLKDGGRGTFIGHSIAEPLPPPPPETPYDDRMRGTLFGHMLHLPDLKLPAPEEPSSRELTIVDRSAPTSHAVELYQPEGHLAAAGVPDEAEAFPRSERYRSIPIDLDAPAKNKVWIRVGIAAAAIAAIVGAAVIWLHTSSSDEPELSGHPAAPSQPARPPVAPPVVPAPPPAAGAPPAPPAAKTATVEPPAAAPASKPIHDLARPAAERARTLTVRPSTALPDAPAARPGHHHAAAEPGEAPPPPKPRSSRKAAPEDDPDGTLAPTIE